MCQRYVGHLGLRFTQFVWKALYQEACARPFGCCICFSASSGSVERSRGLCATLVAAYTSLIPSGKGLCAIFGCIRCSTALQATWVVAAYARPLHCCFISFFSVLYADRFSGAILHLILLHPPGIRAAACYHMLAVILASSKATSSFTAAISSKSHGSAFTPLFLLFIPGGPSLLEG
jgi:hypothetical protein